MRVDVITLFPEYFHVPLRIGPLRKAQDVGSLHVFLHDPAHYADHPKAVDDLPYGGGAGMVMRPEPIVRILKKLPPGGKVIYLSPQGIPLCQKRVEVLSREPHLVLIAGRYLGLDSRVVEAYVDLEISVGDYILSGGEPAVLVLLDAVARLLPGALGDQASQERDSFTDTVGGLLAGPLYTRPPVFEGREVPTVLRSGHHEAIRRFFRKEALRKTLHRRLDLLRRIPLTEEDRALIREIAQEEGWDSHHPNTNVL